MKSENDSGSLADRWLNPAIAAAKLEAARAKSSELISEHLIESETAGHVLTWLTEIAQDSEYTVEEKAAAIHVLSLLQEGKIYFAVVDRMRDDLGFYVRPSYKPTLSVKDYRQSQFRISPFFESLILMVSPLSSPNLLYDEKNITKLLQLRNACIPLEDRYIQNMNELNAFISRATLDKEQFFGKKINLPIPLGYFGPITAFLPEFKILEKPVKPRGFPFPYRVYPVDPINFHVGNIRITYTD